jgi:hypothetical protein
MLKAVVFAAAVIASLSAVASSAFAQAAPAGFEKKNYT